MALRQGKDPRREPNNKVIITDPSAFCKEEHFMTEVQIAAIQAIEKQQTGLRKVLLALAEAVRKGAEG